MLAPGATTTATATATATATTVLGTRAAASSSVSLPATSTSGAWLVQRLGQRQAFFLRALLGTYLLLRVKRFFQSLHENLRITISDRHAEVPRVQAILATFVKLEAASRGFVPTFWMHAFPGSAWHHGSIHTILHTLVRRSFRTPVIFDREIVRLSDGGIVALDWAFPPAPVPVQPKQTSSTGMTPVVVMHHGLCGDAESPYVSELAHMLITRRGWNCCCLVARGCGGLKLSTPEGFTAHRTQDMREAVNVVRKRFPLAPILMVGWSLGGTILIKYLAEQCERGDSNDIIGAVSLSPVWDANEPPEGFSPWSSTYLVDSLKEWVEANKEMLTQHPNFDLETVLASKNTSAYDAAAVVPIHGFESVEHYYRESSARTHAPNITIPTLALSADDDPVCNGYAAPSGADAGPGLVVARTDRGGHVGWGMGLSGHLSWMDQVVLDWLDSCVENA